MINILFTLVLLCSVAFAINPSSDVLLIPGNKVHLINVDADLKDIKVSYDSKGKDFMITIKSPDIAKSPAASSIKNFDNSFIMSAMATRINGDAIQILLKEYKLPTNNIQMKQKDNAILFYLNPSDSIENNNTDNNTDNNANNNVGNNAEIIKDENVAPKQTVEISPKKPLTLFVMTNTANLRQLPAINSEIAGKGRLGEKFIATQKKDEWYAVKSRKGNPVWIHESVVCDTTTFAEIDPKKKVSNKVEEEYTIPPVKNLNNGYNAELNEYIILANDDDVKHNNEPKPLPAFMDSTHKTETENVPQEIPDTNSAKKYYTYHKKGRDPFLPLDKSDFIREGLPNINNITLVGILYDAQDAIALFEEKKGSEIVAFSMKIGDPVISGKLLKIEPNKVVFLLRESSFSYVIEKELNIN
jgi:hypothetical protein